jgi:predicted GH43/DUF377 family glycosyl hydrolase
MTVEYPKNIPTIVDLLGAKIKQIARFCDEPVWSAFNASVCYTEEHGYLVLFRSSNGFLKDHRPEWQAPLGEELTTADSYDEPSEWYTSAYINSQLGSEKLFQNKMFIAKLNPTTLTISNMQEVDLTGTYASFEKKTGIKLFRGIEDGRLYHDGSTLRISANIYEENKITVAKMCNLPLDMSSGKPIGGDMIILESPIHHGTVEKNWMPVHRPSLTNPDDITYDYIYSCSKTYNIDGGVLKTVGGYDLPIRGGSQVIGLDNGTMLAIIHQTVTTETIRFAALTKENLIRRRYLHRFIQLNEKGQVIKVSEMFNFLNKSIEFAAGLAIKDGKVIVSFGALDSSSHVASLPLKNILANLREPKGVSFIDLEGPEN